jgi:hypothetical protein
MSRKALNKTNLERLGSPALADLVLDLVCRATNKVRVERQSG